MGTCVRSAFDGFPPARGGGVWVILWAMALPPREARSGVKPFQTTEKRLPPPIPRVDGELPLQRTPFVEFFEFAVKAVQFVALHGVIPDIRCIHEETKFGIHLEGGSDIHMVLQSL